MPPTYRSTGAGSRAAVLDPASLPGSDRRLEVYVIYTDVPATLAALRAAGELASQLHAKIHLLVPHVVPYPRPLESPAVSFEFIENRFRTLAGGQSVETDVQVCLCRDRKEHLISALTPNCVAVLGEKTRHWGPCWLGRWLPGKERKLAKALERRGVHVVLVSV